MPVRFHPAVRKDIREASNKVRLSEADVVRKSVEMGLPALIAALTVAPPEQQAA